MILRGRCSADLTAAFDAEKNRSKPFLWVVVLEESFEALSYVQQILLTLTVFSRQNKNIKRTKGRKSATSFLLITISWKRY